MLRDLKIWIEQFERDLSRTQMTEASLQEKYQVFLIFLVLAKEQNVVEKGYISQKVMMTVK